MKQRVVKWVYPEYWGFRGWSVLFGVSKGRDFHKIVHLLPFVLPCFTCRCCCGKFIKKSPPEKSDPIDWLCELRQNVFARNLKSTDANRLDIITNSSPPLTKDDILARFRKRQRNVSLWLYDLFLFLSCVAITLNLETDQEDRTRWTQLCTYLTNSSPVPIQLPIKEPKTVEEALELLTAHPMCPSNVILTTLATVPVKTRIM